MASPMIQYRIPDAKFYTWLEDRQHRMYTESPSEQARRELGLWRGVLAMELRRVRFTLAEAICLADVLNGSTIDATVGQLLLAEVYDAFRLARETPLPGESSYGTKHGIDEQRLIDVIAALGPAADHALRDAFSRWWATDSDVSVEGFRAVGLNVAADTDEKTTEPAEISQ